MATGPGLTLRFSDGKPWRRAAADGLQIIVIGDFAARDAAEIAGPDEPRLIEIDSVDAALQRLAPTLRLDLGGGDGETTVVTIRELGDFHPDGLFASLPMFESLRLLRTRLCDPRTFAAAATEVQQWATPAAITGSSETIVPAAESDGETLARLFGTPPALPRERPGSAAERAVAGLVARAVASAPAAVDTAGQGLYVAAVDAAIADRMRSLLHHPRLQRLESAWRSLAWLLSRIEDAETLSVRMLDMPRDALLADVRAAGTDVTNMALYRRLGEESDSDWKLFIADLSFSADGADIALAAALTAAAAAAGGSLLAGAAPSLLGCRGFGRRDDADPYRWVAPEATDADRWRALRRFDLAGRLGLVLPRVLLRLPYGRATDPIDGFAFEELTDPDAHEQLLWGNGAFAVAILLAQQVIGGGRPLTLDGLPAYVIADDGGGRLKPCAEAVLSEHAAEVALAHGIMPLLSHSARPMLRLARLQSVAEPAAPFDGPWS